MADAATLVLSAFASKPRLCVHVIMEATGLPREVVLKTASELVRAGELRRIEEGVKGEYLFLRVKDEVDIGMARIVPKLPVLLGLSEDEARARVLMLQSMKRRLICDWHPILNKIIADYEDGLKFVEGLRCAPDDDDV